MDGSSCACLRASHLIRWVKSFNDWQWQHSRGFSWRGPSQMVQKSPGGGRDVSRGEAPPSTLGDTTDIELLDMLREDGELGLRAGKAEVVSLGA